jgi:hypothetical protein
MSIWEMGDLNLNSKIKGTPLAEQLLHAGRAMHQVVPEPIRQHYPMTMDAVVDATGKVHFLEANCNPLLHPAFYPPMLDAIFKPTQTP